MSSFAVAAAGPSRHAIPLNTSRSFSYLSTHLNAQTTAPAHTAQPAPFPIRRKIPSPFPNRPFAQPRAPPPTKLGSPQGGGVTVPTPASPNKKLKPVKRPPPAQVRAIPVHKTVSKTPFIPAVRSKPSAPSWHVAAAKSTTPPALNVTPRSWSKPGEATTSRPPLASRVASRSWSKPGEAIAATAPPALKVTSRSWSKPRETAAFETARSLSKIDSGQGSIPGVGWTDARHAAPPHVSTDDRIPDTSNVSSQGRLEANGIKLSEVVPEREMKIARLRPQLSRVLFSPGVHFMQDPRSGVYNFEPENLEHIPKPSEYAYHRSPQYTSPGKHRELADLADKEDCKFTGSTSTLTKALSQIYFALSGGRGVDTGVLSQAFATGRTDYTFGATLPACLVIGKQPNGRYYIDNEKSYDTDNVLSDYGVILEKMLTSEKEDFKRFLTSAPEEAVTPEERTQQEAYRYQRSRTILMRSQLDCQDPRLPGTGVFDIKTRACLPIRHDRANYVANSAYDISKERGYSQSYEREYYDLIRAGLLKFSLQARIGMMDGIFVAYHNTARIFGFQYLPLAEIDERLFGTQELGVQAFKLSVSLLEVLLAEIIQAFPDQDVRVTIKHMQPQTLRTVTAFVEPKDWKGEGDVPIQAITLGIDSALDGERVHGPIAFSVDESTRKAHQWTVNWTISKTDGSPQSQEIARSGKRRAVADMLAVMTVALPDGKNAGDMQAPQSIRPDEGIGRTKWRSADKRIVELRKEAVESGRAYEERKKGWRGGVEGSWEELSE